MAANKLKPPFEIKKDPETGRHIVKINPNTKSLMTSLPIFVALATDSNGHYCIYRGNKRKITNQKERYSTPDEALEALSKIK